MSKKQKHILVKVGNHLIDPKDVACISKIKDKDLYIVRLKSQPNMEFPIWVKKGEIEALTNQFELIVED